MQGTNFLDRGFIMKQILRQCATIACLGTLGFSATAALAGYKTGPVPASSDEVFNLKSEASSDEDCSNQWDSNSDGQYCVLRSVDKNTNDIYIEAYLLLDKSDPRYSSADAILTRYMDFARWPAYLQSSGSDAIKEFRTSQVMFLRSNTDGSKTAAHYFDYTSKAPVVGSTDVRGTATYTLFAHPMAGAVVSAEFKMTEKWGPTWDLITPMPGGLSPKGTKGQDANFHIVDFADENAYLVVYRTRVRLAAPILIDLSSTYVTNAVKAILRGMFITSP